MRDQAAVVEMGVGEEHGVEVRRVVGERDAIADRLIGASLEEAAIDEHPGAVGDEEELGAGHGGGSAEEVDLHRRIVTRLSWRGSVSPSGGR